MTDDTRMTTTGLGPLAAALAKAQAQFPSISRDREVTVQTKTGGKYTFRYAPLDTILAAVRAPMSTNGLAISQLLDGPDLVTLLMHESGAIIEGRTMIPREPGANVQQLGSAITYLRRYAIQAILGIASEEGDDDGNAAAGNKVTRQRAEREPASASAAQAADDPDDAAAREYERSRRPDGGIAQTAAPAGPVPTGVCGWGLEKAGHMTLCLLPLGPNGAPHDGKHSWDAQKAGGRLVRPNDPRGAEAPWNVTPASTATPVCGAMGPYGEPCVKPRTHTAYHESAGGTWPFNWTPADVAEPAVADLRTRA